MSDYGIQILNDSGQTVIDSRQNASLLYAGPATTNTDPDTYPDYPETGWTGSQLILARPASSTPNFQTVGRKSNGGWSKALSGSGPLVWRELRAQRDDNLTPSGYGLVVYAEDGSGDILFSAADLDVTAELVATGPFDGTEGTGTTDSGYYRTFTMDPALDAGRYYVMVPNTASVAQIRGGRRLHLDYKFDYANGEIRIQNYRYTVDNTDSLALTRDLPYAIFYIRNGGSTDDNFV